MFHAPSSETKQQSDSTRTQSPRADSSAPAPFIPGYTQSRGQLARLHSTYGNQAVLRMSSQSAPAIQTKLAVNQPGDVFEQEADRVADQVMRMTAPAPGIQRKCSSCAEKEKLQRKRAECEEEEKKTGLQRKESGAGPQFAPPSVHSVLNSPGRPLDPATRVFMEPRFGHDFSGVRVHTGPDAAESARSVNALAYTVGRNVVFANGQYAPESTAGRKLLAHELAHTIQQGEISQDHAAIGISTTTQTAVQRASDCDSAKPSDPDTLGPAFVKPKTEVESLGLKKSSVKDPAQGLSYVLFNPQCDAGKAPMQGLVQGSDAYLISTGKFYNQVWAQQSGKSADSLYWGWINPGLLGTSAPAKDAGAPPSPPPDKSAPKDAGDKSAPQKDQSPTPAATPAAGSVPTPQRYAQLRCVIEKGGCPQSVDGGLPDPSKLGGYNKACKDEQKTGYTGDDVIPTTEECAALPVGSVLPPVRVKQAQDLVAKYQRAVQGGALTPQQVSEIEAALADVNQKLGDALQKPSAPAAPAEPAAPPKDEAPKVASAGVGVLPALSRLPAAAVPGVSGAVLALLVTLAAGFVIAAHEKEVAASKSLEVLIGLLVAAFSTLTDAEIERKIRELEEARKKGKPEDTEPKPRLIPCMPTGLTKLDPIAMTWYKVVANDYYPLRITLQGKDYERDSPDKLPNGEPIGVPLNYWPKVGKTFQLDPEERGPNADRFRAVLGRYGFDWTGLDADHVQDLQWSGPDIFNNLWPLDSGANRSAGGRQNNTQMVEFCETATGPRRAMTLQQMKDEGRTGKQFFGRWFQISKVER